MFWKLQKKKKKKRKKRNQILFIVIIYFVPYTIQVPGWEKKFFRFSSFNLFMRNFSTASLHNVELMEVSIDGVFWRIKFCRQCTNVCAYFWSIISSEPSSSTIEGPLRLVCLRDWCHHLEPVLCYTFVEMFLCLQHHLFLLPLLEYAVLFSTGSVKWL